mgnify:CR=1 FL=1
MSDQPKQASGNAFARFEVDSIHVSPRERFVVSLIVSIDASSSAEAAKLIRELVKSQHLSIFVHDRDTGLTEEMKPDIEVPPG